MSNKTGTLCRIDSADPVTNSAGNVSLAGPDNTDHTLKTPQTVWVWTGDVGMIVVSATELFRYDLPEPMAPNLAASRTLVSDDSGGATLFRYGSDRTITLQLQHVATGPPEVITDTSSGTPTVGKSAKWSYVVRHCSVATTDGTCADANRLYQSPANTITSDSSGQATISEAGISEPTPGTVFTDGDNDPATPDVQTVEERWVSVVVTSVDNAPTAANTVNAPGTASTEDTANSTRVFVYKFSDQVNAAAASGGKVTHQSPYVVSTTAPAARGSQLVTVTVNDQYGSPMAGQEVTLTAATATDVSVVGGPYSTDSSGQAVIVYTITSTATQGFGQFEVIANVGTTEVARGTVHFAQANVATKPSGTAIQYIDVANKTIVADTGANTAVVVYDSGDQFNIGGTPMTMAEFEKALTEESMGAINDTIEWSNYPADPTKRSTTTSSFDLTRA